MLVQGMMIGHGRQDVARRLVFCLRIGSKFMDKPIQAAQLSLGLNRCHQSRQGQQNVKHGMKTGEGGSRPLPMSARSSSSRFAR